MPFIQRLIDNNANLDLKYKNGQTALEIIEHLKSLDDQKTIIELIIQKNSSSISVVEKLPNFNNLDELSQNLIQ